MQIDSKIKISRLHYITQEVAGYTHAELAEQACLGGADWVQLRVKDKSYEEWLEIAKQTKTVCDKYGVSLIINDHVEIAKLLEAQGVHLGKTDMTPAEARKILGDNSIVGGTANSLEEVMALLHAPIDYIGLGPFRFTTTKKNLSPVLGLDGIKKIIHKTGVSLPVIAIGGIVIEDLDLILAAGIHGVALSSAINLAKDKQGATSQFIQKLKNIG